MTRPTIRIERSEFLNVLTSQKIGIARSGTKRRDPSPSPDMTTAAKQIIRSLSSESPVTKRRIVSLQDGIEEEKVGLMASEDTQEEEEEDIQTTTEENTTIAAVSENDDEEHQPLTAVGIDEETAEDPAEPSTDTNGTDSAKPSKKIEPMEIALNDEDDEDLEALLGDSKRQLQQKQQQSRSCCSTCCCCCCCCCGGGSPQRIGNSRVVCPWLYQRTGWGLVGVHWFGPLCVSLVMAWASEYFIRRAWIRIGPISASICIGFTVMSFWLLINTAYRDPGFCVKGDEPDPQKDDLSQWRWCDLCE